MEIALIGELSKFGPIVLVMGIFVFLMRNEISQFLFAPKQDRALEVLLHDMNKLFEKNLLYFDGAVKDTGSMVGKLHAMEHELKMHTQILQRIVEELIRREQR